jgi:hypothetical protein
MSYSPGIDLRCLHAALWNPSSKYPSNRVGPDHAPRHQSPQHPSSQRYELSGEDKLKSSMRMAYTTNLASKQPDVALSNFGLSFTELNPDTGDGAMSDNPYDYVWAKDSDKWAPVCCL